MSGQLAGGAVSGRRLPVLVVVHGGDYVRGAASLLGPQRLMREDVVLVTINYRLGVLGERRRRPALLLGGTTECHGK